MRVRQAFSLLPRGGGIGIFLLVALLAMPAAFSHSRLVVAQQDPENEATLRVVHAAPDSRPVDVYVDGDVALENLAFGEASVFVTVPAGDHQIQVTAAGGTVAQPVIEGTVNLSAGQAYQLVVIGQAADNTISAELQTVNLAPVLEGQARVRVVNASPDAPALDLAVTGGDILLTNVAYPGAAEYQELPAGTHDLEVRPSESIDVLLDLSGTVLDAGAVYDVFMIGLLADDSLQALIVTGQQVTPQEGGRPAHVHEGTCADLDPNPRFPLNNVVETQGPALGASEATVAETSTTTINVSLSDLLASDHAVNVHLSEEDIATYVACGEIGGPLLPNDALAIGLRQLNDSGLSGIAVLTDEGESTLVEVYVAADLGVSAPPAATPVAAEPTAIVETPTVPAVVPTPTEPVVEPTPTEPVVEPTPVPTEEPTAVPTEEPTAVPTEEPTAVPTEEPTAIPTEPNDNGNNDDDDDY